MRKYLALSASFFLSLSALASIPGLVPLDRSFEPKKDTEFLVKNMPSVRSQDGIGLCSAFAAAAVLEHQYCKVENVSDCTKLPNEKRISVLDLSRFSIDSTKLKDSTNPDLYPRMIKDDGTSPAAMMINAGFLAESMIPESCAPFDALVARAQGSDQQDAMEAAMWANFKNAYEQYQKKAKNCAECALQELTSTAKEWKENYNLKPDNVDILKAFSAKTYQEFLSQLIIPKSCYDLGKDIKIPNYNMNVAIWPSNTKDQNYNSAIEKIKSVLRTDQPLVISNICLLEKISKNCSMQTPNGKMSGSHTVVITGYRKMCNKAGKCYETLKVHNSWGQSWQDQNNDGWVLADKLLNSTSYLKNTISWLKPKD